MVLQLHPQFHMAASRERVQAAGRVWVVCCVVFDSVVSDFVVCAGDEGQLHHTPLFWLDPLTGGFRH